MNVITLFCLHSQQHLLMSHELQHVSHQSHPHIQLTSSGLDIANLPSPNVTIGKDDEPSQSINEEEPTHKSHAAFVLDLPKEELKSNSTQSSSSIVPFLIAVMAILSLVIYPQIHIHYTKPFEPDYTYCWIVATAIIVVSELWKLWIENRRDPPPSVTAQASSKETKPDPLSLDPLGPGCLKGTSTISAKETTPALKSSSETKLIKQMEDKKLIDVTTTTISATPPIETNNQMKLQVANLSIKAFAESGRIELRNSVNFGQANIDLRMDGLQETNHNGLKIGKTLSFETRSFSVWKDERKETTAIALIRYMDEHVKIRTIDEKKVAKGSRISLLSTSPGCSLQINAFAVTESGEAGTEFESWSAVRDDFMFTVEILEWPWSNTDGDNTANAAFLDFSIEINTFGCDVQTVADSEFAYELGDDARLLLTNRYFEFNEITKTYEQRFMPEGFPKMAKGDDSKYIFTFRFRRFEAKIFYDPNISWWDNRFGTFEVYGKYRQPFPVHFGKGSGISLKAPFIRATEKARKQVYPCSDEDIEMLIYQIVRKIEEDPFRIVREDAKKMQIKEILDRVRSWNNGDKLKVTFDMFSDASPAAIEHTGTSPPILMLDTTNEPVISGAAATPLTPPSEGERSLTTAKQILDHLSPIEPENCEIMISFNERTAGEEAENLARYLTSHGFRVFCTKTYCRNNAGNWRDVTESGARHCRYYIALMTYGWQLSDECQKETAIVKNRAQTEVTIIPVRFDSFDDEYDEDERGHGYNTIWKHFQGVFKGPDWKERLLMLLSPEENN